MNHNMQLGINHQARENLGVPNLIYTHMPPTIRRVYQSLYSQDREFVEDRRFPASGNWKGHKEIAERSPLIKIDETQ